MKELGLFGQPTTTTATKTIATTVIATMTVTTLTTHIMHITKQMQDTNKPAKQNKTMKQTSKPSTNTNIATDNIHSSIFAFISGFIHHPVSHQPPPPITYTVQHTQYLSAPHRGKLQLIKITSSRKCTFRKKLHFLSRKFRAPNRAHS